MVFVPAEVILSDGVLGVEEAAEKEPFAPTLALLFFDRGISAENNGKLQLRNFPMTNFVFF